MFSRFADENLASSIPLRSICSNETASVTLSLRSDARTQWVRNAEAAGEVTLKRGSTRNKFRLAAIPDADKPQILKAYLDTFKREVQTYFPIPAGSPEESFIAIAASYLAFELLAA